jgi:ABC-type multidrug transport system fused ATPase/permease subunit
MLLRDDRERNRGGRVAESVHDEIGGQMNRPPGKIISGQSGREWIIIDSIRDGKSTLALVLLMVLAGSFLSSVAPLVLGKSLDSILGRAGSMTFTFSGLRLLLLVGVGAILVQFFNQLLQKMFARSFMNCWIPRVCSKVSRIDLRTLESYEAGYVNRRIISELHPIPAFFSIDVPGLVESALVMVFSLVMLVLLLPNVTLVLVGSALLLVPLGLFLAKRARGLLKAVVELWSRLEGATTEFVASQLQIRAYSAEQRMCSHLAEKVQQATGVDLRNSLRVSLILVILLILTIGGVIAFLLYAEKSPGIASAQTGTVVSFLAYLWLFAARVGGVTTAIGRIQNSLACLDRMTEFLNLPETSVETTGNDSFVIESLVVQNLAATIGGRPAFCALSFSARKGDVIAIRGRSGCGKTTLLKTLFGFCPHSSGTILVNGSQVAGLMNLGGSAVLLPQEVRFFSGSLRWNLEMLAGNEVDLAQLSAVLELLHLGDRLDAGLSEITDLSEGGANLSGGERQRLALGAVLLRRPQILLLDEPTSQLDTKTEELILDTVSSLAQSGTIVIIVTHNPGIERIATSMIQLDEDQSTE